MEQDRGSRQWRKKMSKDCKQMPARPTGMKQGFGPRPRTIAETIRERRTVAAKEKRIKESKQRLTIPAAWTHRGFISALAKNPGCRTIGFSGIDKIEPEWLLQMNDLTLLKRLDFSCTYLTDTHLFYIGKLYRLQELRIDCCNAITNAGITHLSRLRNLEFLSMVNCSLKADCLDSLHRLSKMRVLSHTLPDLTNKKIEEIKRFWFKLEQTGSNLDSREKRCNHE